MAKTFGNAERQILNLFNRGTSFNYEGKNYTVVLSGKPTCGKGEPKTDIYIVAEDSFQSTKEFKISFKKENADFLENKTNSERAAQLFGDDWMAVISQATKALQQKFNSRKLIYKSKHGRTDEGAITLGWKFELLNVRSGELSGDMLLSREQVIDVYAGTNLTGDKRDSSVDGKLIRNSGLANFILFESIPISTVQDAIDALISIDDYVDQNPRIYFACKALNYRTFRQKYDGNRPLAVYVDWFATNGKLDCKLCFDSPLIRGGDYAYCRLKSALDILKIKNTDGLNSRNVVNQNIIYE